MLDRLSDSSEYNIMGAIVSILLLNYITVAYLKSNR